MDSSKLQIQKWLPASPEQIFRAWTDPEQMLKWWGPKDVRCVDAEINLTVGGSYRIANQLLDGSVLWISGNYEVVEPPTLLIYTWNVETVSPRTERVTVRFQARDDGTNIELTHEKISTEELRDQHRAGWHGCLNGLVDHLHP